MAALDWAFPQLMRLRARLLPIDHSLASLTDVLPRDALEETCDQRFLRKLFTTNKTRLIAALARIIEVMGM